MKLIIITLALSPLVTTSYALPPLSLGSMRSTVKTGALSDSLEKGAALSESAMRAVFARSKDVHKKSMASIKKSLSMTKALDHIPGNHKLPKVGELKDFVAALFAGGDLATTSLRGKKQVPEPAAVEGTSIDGARHLLNDMIFKSKEKYDAEQSRCTKFYADQCALMTVARGDIKTANQVAADSRKLMLDAANNIDQCNKFLPTKRQEKVDHLRECGEERAKLSTRLNQVEGDISVMTYILEMTDCDTPDEEMVQMEKLLLLKCKNKCTKKDYIRVNNAKMQAHLSKLKSSVTKSLLAKKLGDMFDGKFVKVSLMQADSTGYQRVIQHSSNETANYTSKVKSLPPPVGEVEVPEDPCDMEGAGAPTQEDKDAAKCTIKQSPMCYTLQSRFLAVQGGIQDERDKLKQQIEDHNNDCTEQDNTIADAISYCETLVGNSQIDLAAATTKEANAGRKATTTASENANYDAKLRSEMDICSKNYIDFETEQCALEKIRTELFKMSSEGHDAFFMDCDVDDWKPTECTKECGGGEQNLTRNIVDPQEGGAACLPLRVLTSCNQQPCKVDCVMEEWGGWGKCSAECDSGVQYRVRKVEVAARYGGEECDAVREEQSCNVQSCDKDCELSKWSKWTKCSKKCNHGTKKRIKWVKAPAEGKGSCAGAWDIGERLEYEDCNTDGCTVAPGRETMTCWKKDRDIVLMIDSCPSNGEAVFQDQILAAKKFADAYMPLNTSKTTNAQFAIVSYCGPRTWSGVSKCTGEVTLPEGEEVDQAKDCDNKRLLSFTNSIDKVHETLNGIEFTKGTKLVTLGLGTVKSELAFSRKKAPATVVVFMDGAPLSYRQTRMACHAMREKARVHFVVTQQSSPVEDVETWVTRRWEENLVTVDVTQPTPFSNSATVNAIVANVCAENYTPKKKKKKTMSEEEAAFNKMMEEEMMD